MGESAPSRPRVLYVDDETDLLRLFERHFRKGYEVVTAEGGGEALAAVIEQAPFDVIVADMAMPGMDGAKLLERMRRISPQTVRLLWTGQPDLQVAMQAVNQGHVFKFIAKPCPMDALERFLREAVREGQRQATRHSQVDPSISMLAESSHAQPERPDAATLRSGSLVQNRYMVEGVIGRGGMATVYAAKDLVLGEKLALKVYHGTDVSKLDPRIKRELSLCRALAHDHIARLYEIGAYGTRPFISMELLKGSDLRPLLDAGVRLEDALSYLLQACSALAYAHDRGVVHRDLKPENLFLTREGVLKVMDFGLAKHMAAGHSVTGPGVVAGTLGYMSPEQMRGLANVTHLTDVYALGAVGYELVTGRMPFECDSVQGLVAMTMVDRPPDPDSLAELPEGLGEVLMTCLEREPARRFQNVAALHSALTRIRSHTFPEAV